MSKNHRSFSLILYFLEEKKECRSLAQTNDLVGQTRGMHETQR